MSMSNNQKISRLLFWFGQIMAFLFVFFVSSTATYAASTLDYQLLGTHPEASAQSSLVGKHIHKLEVFNNKLYAGYGDYDANTGPITINPYSFSTSDFLGSQLTVPTEQISQLRIINGKLYAPTIDPTCPSTCAAGFAVGESWANKLTLSSEHVYDVSTLNGTDLWAAGSGNDYAKLWHSTDNGDSWTLEQSETSPGSPGGYERYYWVAALDNKLYTQAGNITPQPPVRIFDGSTWTTGTTDAIAPPESRVVVFGGKIITTKNGLSAYDGTTISTVSSYSGTVLDMYAGSDGYLYVLSLISGSRYLSRTADLESWIQMGQAPDTARSIAVDSNKIYIGTDDSKLYQASLAGVPLAAPRVVLGGIVNNQTVSGTINLTADITSEAAVTRLQFKRDLVSLELYNDDVVTSYAWDTTATEDGTYVITANITDEFGTAATSEEITVVVDNSKTGSESGGNSNAQSTVSFFESIAEQRGYSSLNDKTNSEDSSNDVYDQTSDQNADQSSDDQNAKDTRSGSKNINIKLLGFSFVLLGFVAMTLVVKFLL